ncbi:MAG: DMT family transporter [Ruminococcaceae bacterium]|nr:DMT family transporter [Oscillospiraceae bacterium]
MLQEVTIELERNKKISLAAKFALLASTLIWGCSFMVMKDTVGSLPPHMLLGIRFTLGALLLTLIFIKKFKGINLKYILEGAFTGILLFCAYCAQTLGLTTTTPGKNAFLTSVYCIIVPFMFWVVNRKRPDIYNVVAAVICIVGIGFVSLEKGFVIGTGDLLTLLGGFFYAAHIIAVARFSKGKDPIVYTILQFAAAAVMSWLVWLCFEYKETDFSVLASGDIIFNLVYLVVCATATALLLQNIGQKYTDPSSASIILSLESVFGVAFSVMFYNEQLTVKLVVGFALIFIAVIVSETKLSFLLRKNPFQTDKRG